MFRLAVVGGVAVVGLGAGYAYWSKSGLLNRFLQLQPLDDVAEEDVPSIAPSTTAAALLGDNAGLFSSAELALVSALLEEGQGHLFQGWPALGDKDSEKKALVSQLTWLDDNYSGGLIQYIKNAKKLLQDAKTGTNPFDGYTPYIPAGEKLDFASEVFQSFEQQGLQEAGSSAFVLVAGGLGERLGYSGIKLSLPTESVTRNCFLQLYILYILAIQNAAGSGKKLPLVIMTSDDTHSRTEQLLKENDNFGMAEGQVILLKQEKVPCLTDNDAHLALDPSNPFTIQTKPHGHGDVHSLLAKSGLVDSWQQQGIKWVCFFQDTNALVFRALLGALGVSKARDFEMNSLAVPRKAKEAIGALALLKHTDGSSLTINVEYNQLEPLLKATINPEGDVNDESGYSPFPGNINQLVFKVDSYAEQLRRTGGVIAEFVNPKYKDATKTAFKSSTRLECMMQDYPKCLPTSAKVGFTLINQVWATYSPVKNCVADAQAKAKAGNPTHSATTGELDIYKSNCLLLKSLVGANIPDPTPAEFNGIPVKVYPHVVLSPSFAPSTAAVQAKISPGSLTLHPGSVLVLDGSDIQIDSLSVSGALVVRAVPGAKVVIKDLVVDNAGWVWEPLKIGAEVKEEDAIRGFTVEKLETYELVFDQPGEYIIPEPPTAEEAAVFDGVASDVVQQIMGTPAPSMEFPELVPASPLSSTPLRPTILFAAQPPSTPSPQDAEPTTAAEPPAANPVAESAPTAVQSSPVETTQSTGTPSATPAAPSPDETPPPTEEAPVLPAPAPVAATTVVEAPAASQPTPAVEATPVEEATSTAKTPSVQDALEAPTSQQETQAADDGEEEVVQQEDGAMEGEPVGVEATLEGTPAVEAEPVATSAPTSIPQSLEAAAPPPPPAAPAAVEPSPSGAEAAGVEENGAGGSKTEAAPGVDATAQPKPAGTGSKSQKKKKKKSKK